MGEHILILSADKEASASFAEALRREGYTCSVTATPNADAIAGRAADGVDLVVADGSATGVDPAALCRDLRSVADIPIVALYNSRRHNPEQRAACLDEGADDCLPKSVDPRLFVAHIRALLQTVARSLFPQSGGRVLDLGELEIDLGRRSVALRGEELRLSAKEFELLAALGLNEGAPVASADLLKRIWGYDESVRTRTLDVHIYRLRLKLEADPAEPQLIVTVRRFGYKLCCRRAPAARRRPRRRGRTKRNKRVKPSAG